MRINIEIDDKLMAAAMKAGGFATKKETVEAALKILARKRAYQKVLALGGQLKWEGDLDTIRAAPDHLCDVVSRVTVSSDLSLHGEP